MRMGFDFSAANANTTVTPIPTLTLYGLPKPQGVINVLALGINTCMYIRHLLWNLLCPCADMESA